jgi:hypothetical protein
MSHLAPVAPRRVHAVVTALRPNKVRRVRATQDLDSPALPAAGRRRAGGTTIRLTFAEWNAAHDRDNRFTVAADHEDPNVETVVARHDTFLSSRSSRRQPSSTPRHAR